MKDNSIRFDTTITMPVKVELTFQNGELYCSSVDMPHHNEVNRFIMKEMLDRAITKKFGPQWESAAGESDDKMMPTVVYLYNSMTDQSITCEVSFNAATCSFDLHKVGK